MATKKRRPKQKRQQAKKYEWSEGALEIVNEGDDAGSLTYSNEDEPIDLHLPGRHIQKSHGSWSAKNPFHSSHRKANMKIVGGKGKTAKGGGDAEPEWKDNVQKYREANLPILEEKLKAREAAKEAKKPKNKERYGLRVPGRDRTPEEVIVRGAEGGKGGEKSKQIAARAAATENFLAERYPNHESRWMGRVDVASSKRIGGALARKTWGCSIEMSKEVEDRMVAREETMLHEFFHAFSKAEPDHYEIQPGWEEAVVEKQNRLNYTALKEYQGESPEEAKRLRRIAHNVRWERHPYNRYIKPLEKLRVAMGEGEQEFWDDLFDVPASQRAQHLWSKITDKYAENDYARYSKLTNILFTADAAMYRGR